MLEDIAMMRVLPNMTVVVPCDSIEAAKATVELSRLNSPGYLRLAREKTAVITHDKTPFEIGKAVVMREGRDVSILACGPLLYEALKAAEELQKKNISVEVLNVATIKPLDTETILNSAIKTKRVITVEEGQAFGGLGGAVTEYLSQVMPVPIRRVGVLDRFGQSGTIDQLWVEYQLDASAIIKQIMAIIKEK